MKNLFVASALCACSVGLVSAAETPERTIYHIPRIEGEIEVDAILDEPAWKKAVEIDVAWETWPGENLPAPAATEAYLMHDDQRLYIGIRAHDPNPDQIRAHYTDRDTAFQDDFVGVILDTFNDLRRGYEFFVNPLGVQGDLTNDQVIGGEDSSWDAIWSSAGRLTDDGYVVEIAIPFSQLRFPRSDEELLWGIDVIRIWPRDQRRLFSSQPNDRDLDCGFCEISLLEGFAGIEPGRNLEVDPTVTALRSERRSDFPDGDFETVADDVELGVTARWGITPSLTALGTINPDFSQVEADAAQLDINTTFALFYPEKRPFFLEGADYFSTPIDAVYTRTVADPSWGVKLTGKQGKNAFGAFVAADDTTNLIIPGVEESALASLDEENVSGVFRWRRDVGGSSTVGVLLTGRSGDGYSNTVAGVDGLLRLGSSDAINFQLLRSETEYPEEVSAAHAQPEGSFSDEAFYLRYRHNDEHWFWHATYRELGDGFRADSGFVPRVGYRIGTVGIQRTFYGDEDDWYTEWQVGTDFDHEEETADGDLIADEHEVWATLSGPMQSFVLVDHVTRTRVFRNERFEQQLEILEMSIRPSGSIVAGLDVRTGDGLDVVNVRNGDLLNLNPSLEWRAGRRLRLSLDHVFERMDVDGGQLYEANLSELRAVYQLDLRTFVRAILQYRDVSFDPSLYTVPQEPEVTALFTQLLFSYTINPQTVFYLGYSDNYRGFDEVALTQSDRTVFLKIGYAWLP